MRNFSLWYVLALTACIGSGLLFGYIVTAIGNESIKPFDLAVIHFVQGMETPWLTTVMKGFTWIGSWYIVTPITLIAFFLLFFGFHYRQQAFLLVTVIIGTVSLNGLLKIYFKRERPDIYRVLDASGFSFPSGHTMMAFSLYVILAYIIWRNVKTPLNRVLLILFAGIMIVMIATSRIYLGVHYPSDIVGGFAASAVWLVIAITGYALFQNHQKKAEAH